MEITNLEAPLLQQNARESASPMRYQVLNENRAAIRDLVILSILSIFTFIFLALNDFTELFFEFTRSHEGYNLDEVIFLGLLVLAIYLPVFAIRRWSESIQRLKQANIDSLTGLISRRKGEDTLDLEMARARRYQRPLSIIMFDIDHFKAVNDQHGHLAGDQVLRAIAKTAQEKLRTVDIPIRWGGEEFLVISPESDRQAALQLAERLRREIERTSAREDMQVTASFGVAQLQENDSHNSFFLRADTKLYEAKAAGRNKVA